MKVVCTYRDGKVVCVGENLTLTLTISLKELSRMYWGKEGRGDLVIEDELPPTLDARASEWATKS